MVKERRAAAGRSTDPADGAELADLASESVIVCDLEGVIRYWNLASEALYGWPAMATVGRSIAELSASADLDAEHWRELLREGRWLGPVRRRTSTGSPITALVRRTVRHDEAGAPLDIVEYGQNAPIGVAEAGPRPLIEPQGGGAACWELDMSGARQLLRPALAGGGREAADPEGQAAVEELLALTRIVCVNDRTARVFGRSSGREPMMGEPVVKFWPAENRDVLARLLVDAASRAPSEIIQQRLPDAQGLLRNATLTAWRSVASGRADTVFLMIHGVTTDDRTAWELRASEERYRKLIHYMPTALWQVDARGAGEIFDRLRTEGVTDIAAFLEAHPEIVELGQDIVRVTDVNRDAVSLFRGRSAAELIGPVRYLFAATPDAARRVMIAHFEGRRNHVEQTRILTFDGQTRDALLCVTYPMPPEQQDTTFITITDITERLRTEVQLNQLQADHAHAARISTLGELATSIAHEVKQPLAAIVTNAETSLRWLSRDDVNVEKLQQLTSRIISSARRASDIVQHIRSMAQRGERERIPLDMNEVLEEALLFVRHELESRRIDLAIAAPPSRPRVLGDRIQLQQVIVNLIINSGQAIAQADSAERWIRIAIEADTPGVLRFSVDDSGPGIAAGNLDRVFESFFTTKDGGMGIGLTVCQSIITAHGGRIEASSHHGGGASFRFSLPAIAPETQA